MTAVGGEVGSGAPGRTPLLHADWSYIDKPALNDFTLAELDLLNEQRRAYYAEHQATAVLAAFSLGSGDPSFGYQINQYHHGLQSATMLLRAGYDEEDVVVGLLHDIGFVLCPDRHGAFAAELLGPYISDRNVWMLRHHQRFGSFPPPPRGEARALPRDAWVDHPYYDWTVTFVEEFDQNAMDPDYDSFDLSAFEPLVRRLFAGRIRTPQTR